MTESSGNLGGQVKISGCSFWSPILLKEADVYWLQDGYNKISATVTISDTTATYVMKDLLFQATNYTSQGYYQCVINVTKTVPEEVKSNMVHIQFKGDMIFTLFLTN